jgi:hypothetical protein
MSDRESYRPQARATALARARQRKGQMGWDNKVTRGTQEHKPGTGGLSMGRNTQGQRQAQESAKVQRSEALRAEKPVY